MEKPDCNMENTALTQSELQRYARHLSLPGFGLQAQLKLKQSRVLVIGAGGLGSPVLMYLAAAGVGRITIIDFDQVEQSNLQRQILYSANEQGASKAVAAAARIRALNPEILVESRQEPFSRENARQLIRAHDLVVDGTDNFPTRYLSNDACVLEGKPLIYGSIYRFEGQVSVFNLQRPDGSRGPNYRDLFPTPPPPELVPNCAEGGVIGVLPGIIGSMQANEAIKVLSGTGMPLDGKLYVLDAGSMLSRTINIRKNPDIQITELIDYEQFCNPAGRYQPPAVSVQELQEWRQQGSDFQLIDVREPSEYEIANLGGQLRPLADLEQWAPEYAKTQRLVLHCRSGQRSARAVKQLQEMGYQQVFNLEGGLLAWAKEIDPGLPAY